MGLIIVVQSGAMQLCRFSPCVAVLFHLGHESTPLIWPPKTMIDRLGANATATAT